MKTAVDVRIGTYLMLEIGSLIEEVIVDQNYYLPTMFTILLHADHGVVPGTYEVMDNILRLNPGTSVTIQFGRTNKGVDILIPHTVVNGEVTSIEPIFRDGGAWVRIRGYDKGHRLTHGKATRTYGDGNPFTPGIGDADIVRKIAQEAGLVPSVDSLKLTTMRYKYVMQYNQNDWDFLWTRAEQVGYQVYVEDSILYFVPAGKPRSLTSVPSPLTYGENLIRFEPRLTMMGQMTAAEAYGWNSSLKQGVSSTMMVDTSLNATKTSGTAIPPNAMMKTAFGSSAKSAVIDPSISNVGAATIVAGAEYSRAASSYLQAYGELDEGDPYLAAGVPVAIDGVGTRFSGIYYVTQVKHIFRNGRYTSTFSVTGGQPNTFRSLILGHEADHQLNRVGGVMTGIVTSVSDPENLGRIKVKYPWLPKAMGAELSSGWARVAIPGGGSGRGVLFLPEVNDEVLVAFQNGDMSDPYVIGVLYNSMDKMPVADGPIVDAAQKKVNTRMIVSRSGHKVVLDDSTGKEKFSIIDKTGKNLIEFDSVKNEVTIKSGGKLIVETTGDMSFNSTGKLDITSKGNLTISSDAQVDMKSKAALNLEGTQKVDVKAGPSELALQAAGAELKGTKIDVKANTQLGLNGTAMVQVQGGIVKIN